MGGDYRTRLGSKSLWLTALFALLMALSSTGQALAQASGILKVQANVEGANVVIDGEVIGQTPLIYELEAGSYTVQIEAKNFEPYKYRFNLDEGQAVSVEAILTSLVGSLSVECNVEGAKVTVDGVEVGSTPDVLVEGLADGNHDVTITAAGYLGYSSRILIQKGAEKSLQIELTANAARLSVVTALEGATVEVDGEVVGTTPLTEAEISGGRHSLKISQSGRTTYFQSFQVRVGDHFESSIELPEEGGDLKIKANRKDALVYLEGLPVGTAPLKLEQLAPGNYTVRVSKDGYVQQVLKVDIRAKRGNRVKADLQAEEKFATASTKELGERGRLDAKWWAWAIAGGVVAGAAGGGVYYYNNVAQSGSSVGQQGDVAVQLP